MPESLLTILKFFFLALVWLFFLRVLRAVWAEISRPAPPVALAPGPASPGPASPAPPRRRRDGAGVSRLTVVAPNELRGRSFDLGEQLGELSLGRADSCGITLPDKTISHLHARLFRRDGRVFLEDLGSTNGTFLNAKKLSRPVALQRGDRITVGKTVLEVGR